MSARKVLILGSTGGTGRHALSIALQRGHDVTVLVRDRARLAPGAERARVLVGSLPENASVLEESLRGQDAVLSSLGRGMSLKSESLISRTTPVIVAAMEKGGVSRLVVVSAYGVGETRRDLPALPHLLTRLMLRDIYADKEAAEAAIRGSGLDWTIVYPVTLTNGPATGRYRTGERLSLSGLPHVSRADVADFLVRQLEDETYSRKGVLISS